MVSSRLGECGGFPSPVWTIGCVSRRPAWADRLDRSVETLLATLGYPAEPPLPLEEIARSLGVDEIERVALLEEGRLERTKHGTRILLNAHARPQRQRFTLAHELGHLILADPE